MADTTKQFMDALQQAEQSGDPAPLVALYADDSTTQNLTEEVYRGVDGARDFWQRYLENFQTIRSEFGHVTEGTDTGVMEWAASGKLKDGSDIHYRGVSIIELDGERVKAFRTYYDSAAFVRPEAQAR